MPADWTSAVEGATTFTLVVITGLYVVVTARLVEVSSPTNQLAEHAVAELGAVLNDKHLVRWVVDSFPFDLTEPPPDLRELTENFVEHLQKLDKLSLQMPSPLAKPLLNASGTMWQMATHLAFYGNALAEEAARASAAGETIKWVNIKKAYESVTASKAQTLGAGQRFESWHEFVTGRLANEVQAAYKVVDEAVFNRALARWAP